MSEEKDLKEFEGRQFVIYQTPYEVEALGVLAEVYHGSIDSRDEDGTEHYSIYGRVKFLNTNDKGKSFDRWVSTKNLTGRGDQLIAREATCYFISESARDANGYIPCIAKAGESGYWKTDWNWGNDKEFAKQLAKEKNEQLGLSIADVQFIVSISIFPGSDTHLQMYAAHQATAKARDQFTTPDVY